MFQYLVASELLFFDFLLFCFAFFRLSCELNLERIGFGNMFENDSRFCLPLLAHGIKKLFSFSRSSYKFSSNCDEMSFKISSFLALGLW